MQQLLLLLLLNTQPLEICNMNLYIHFLLFVLLLKILKNLTFKTEQVPRHIVETKIFITKLISGHLHKEQMLSPTSVG